ncbi:Alpha/Beta hydrolase protein [Schizothecium vesticola]|uniref:S-formylglutathione hydrolase n=1 Tax=Schizothecium vesticola TaxID=314040 RepID=A0AA40KBU4_9PEZI|nr:Alpha/Beta hydrolase protein [Schizothecium vesticola]
MSSFETKATIRSFGGKLFKLTHPSPTTTTPMALNLYLPPAALTTPPSRVPVLIYLSGLTCTPDNCTEKGFFQSPASRLGLAVLYPDTSPRGLDIPGSKDAYDFGEAASFYLDATVPPYSAAYKMETYLTSELPSLLFSDAEFGPYLDGDRVSITGHSMGGHGALTLYLRHPGMYQSCSAFAPIVNPTECAWGVKAFRGYLGKEREAWKEHDAAELVRRLERGKELRVLVDQGKGDQFYKEGQLRTEELEFAVAVAGVKGVEVRYQEGYDHSYFFMATFSEEHVEFAAKALGLL